MKLLSGITAAVSGVITTGVLIAATDISIVLTLVAGAATAGAALFAVPSSSENKKKAVPAKLVQKNSSTAPTKSEGAQTELKRLKLLASQIPAEDVRQTLERIVVLAEKLLGEVDEDPRDLHQLRSFYNHYLPSTVTIVSKYVELSRKGTLSENGKETLAKSEKSLDTIEKAFEQQLTNLFDNDILDLDVEVSVLEQSLRMDGLVQKDDRKGHA